MNDLQRFDLDVGIEQIDLDSTLALTALTDCWRARARLRARWLMRNALDALPDFHLDQFIRCDYAKLEHATMAQPRYAYATTISIRKDLAS